MRFDVRFDRRQCLLALGSLAVASPSAAARTFVTDDLGRQVNLALPLKRVVVFNRYTTEFVRAVGAMPTVVGVDFEASKHPAYWPSVTKAMFAGSGQSSPNFEAIVAMQPDAVFMPRNSDWKKAASVLQGFGIPVVIITSWDLLKHEWNLELLGRLFGRLADAARVNAFYRHWRNVLQTQLKGAAPKRVYFEEVGNHKTVLQGSGWHDMIQAGGGKNIFGDVTLPGQATPRGNIQNFEVDTEDVLLRQPEVIIKLQPGQYEPHPREFSVQVLEQLSRRPGLDTTPAVKSGQVFHMSYYLAGGCSKITGALQIAKWLHPERMKAIDVEAAMSSWLTDFQGVPAKTGYWWSLADLKR